MHRSVCFFFNDTATTEIYTLSLHDALPIWASSGVQGRPRESARVPSASSGIGRPRCMPMSMTTRTARSRSEEHTSELQSRQYLVCRLLLEKKNTHSNIRPPVMTETRHTNTP